jgi:hypothetical protein
MVGTSTYACHQLELVCNPGELGSAVAEFGLKFGDPAGQFLNQFALCLLEIPPFEVVVPEPSGTDGIVVLQDEAEEFAALAGVDVLIGLDS